MTNNFNTLKDKVSTEKFYLVRIEPARSIEGVLALESGTTYTATMAQFAASITNRIFYFPMMISKLEVNGVLYTKVSSLTPASGEYSYDEITRFLRINLGAALTTQIVVAHYYIFLSNEIPRQAPQDPMDVNTVFRNYFPRISGEISSTYEQLDVTNGVLSFSNSTVTIDNEDGFFEQFLTNEDSFSFKKIVFWTCIDSYENVRVAFRGFTNNINIGEKVTIDLFDEFSLMNKTYYSNGTFLDSTYNTTRFPSMHPEKENTPIRKIYAEYTSYRLLSDPSSPPSYQVDPDKLLEAVSIDYSENVNTGTNRNWGTILSSGDGGLQTDTVVAVDNTSLTETLIDHGAGKKYLVGDTLTIGAEYVIVLNINSPTQIKINKNILVAVSDTITRPGISCVIIKQGGNNYFALFARDYSVSYVGNTNDIVQLTFVNNFEANHVGMNALDPKSDNVMFRAWTDTGSDWKHADVLQEIVESAGMTINAASFTSANATDIRTNFYVPFIGNDDFPNFFEIVQKFINSTVAIITLNEDLEFIYKLLAAPSGGLEIDGRDLLKSTFVSSIDYNDIVDSLSFVNDHDVIDLNYSAVAIENKKARYLHGITKSKQVNHIMKSFTRAQQLLDILSHRKARFVFTTKTKNLTNIVGDDLNVSRHFLIGNQTDIDVKILSITKKLTEVELVCDDLIGL